MTDPNVTPSPQPEKKHLALEIVDRITPDVRAWVAIGVFGLVAFVLVMIRENPKLLANASFMQLAALLVGSGGLGMVASFFFGGTKSGSEVMTAQNKAVIASAPPADPTTTTSAKP